MGEHGKKHGENKGVLRAHRTKLRDEADARDAVRAERTAEEQLALLDARGARAKRERARLTAKS